MILTGFCVLIGIVVLYLGIVIFAPGFEVPKQPLPGDGGPAGEAAGPPKGRTDVLFDIDHTPISAWLYLPEDLSGPVPCIVMGNGLGGTKDMILEQYALRFRKAGWAVLAFDYRYFGLSGGEPRQLIWIPDQLEDWQGAVRFARGLKEVDPDRIVLWGTSMSGGHVIVTAAQDQQVAGVIAQCPGLDGRASGRMLMERVGIGYLLRMLVHGQRDIFRSWIGLAPHKIPIIGKPGSIALMNIPGANELAKSLPKTYINEACARIALRGDKYRPVAHADKVRCPVLLQICDKDGFTPLSAGEEAERRLGNLADVKHYPNPIGHFDIYFGDHFERAVSDQLAFLKKHL